MGQGRGFSIEGWINPADTNTAEPVAEWYDSAAPTNVSPKGVQLWVGLTNGLASLSAILWDTNGQAHVIATPPMVITNDGWQHVALTYATNNNTAVLYTNGQAAATMRFATNFIPRTSSDFYLGFDPTVSPPPINYPDFQFRRRAESYRDRYPGRQRFAACAGGLPGMGERVVPG